MKTGALYAIFLFLAGALPGCSGEPEGSGVSDLVVPGGGCCWLFDSSSRSWPANCGLAGVFRFSLPWLGMWEPPVAPASGL